MTTVRRLRAAGAGLALLAAITCTQVWGDGSGNRPKKPSVLADAIRAPQEAGPRPAADESRTSRFVGQPVVTYETLQGELHFALQVQPKLTASPRPRDVAVVIDTSASQAGFPLQNARLVAAELAKAAKADDRVAIWTVNTPDATRDLTGGFQAGSAPRLQEALEHLAKREYAAGATDLKEGLRKVLRSFHPNAGRQQVVLFLGDGESTLNPLTDADRAALAADMVSREITFFAVPLGNRLDPKTLHGLSTATGGAVVRKQSGDKADAFIKRLDAALAVPVFYPSAAKPAQFTANVVEALPNRLPPLRGDAPTLVIGLMKPAAAIGFKAEGTVAGKPAAVDVSETVAPALVANYFLVNMVHQWRNADRTAPALVRADRGLALAYEQTRLAREEVLTQAHWALSQNNLDAAEKLFKAARKIDPRDAEPVTGLKVIAKLKDGQITREQIRKQLSDPKAIALRIEKGEDTRITRAQLEELAQDAPAAVPGTPPAPPAPADLLDLERRRRQVQEQQVTQVVDDTVRRARALLGSDPDAAYDLLKRQLASVRENTDLSDAIRATLASRLETALRNTVAEGALVKQRQEAELQRRLADEARRAVAAANASDEERIRERVRAFSALMNQARYEEAYKEALVLQQEQTAKGRPVPVQAVAAYTMGLNAANLREFEELRRIKEDRYLLTMLQVERSHVPFPDEPPVAFPPAATWRELSNYRKDRYSSVGLEGEGSRKALQIRDKLNQSVSIDKPIENTPLKDVLDFLSDKYDVTFIIDVQAFDRDNGNRMVEDAQVRLPKMPGVSLGTIMRFVLAQVQGTLIIRRDYIEITTNNASIAEKAVRAYPAADLVIPIPNAVNQQGLQQNLQVLGSSLSANGQAIFGALGGGQALGFGGPLGALGTLGALGALGGVGGGAALGVAGGAQIAGGGATGAQFQGSLGFAGGNNQTNLGFGGGTLGFGGGQQGQFGNLGGQFGLQGGDTSAILIELIKDVIAPKEWNDRAARYLFNATNVETGDDEQPILNPDMLNSMGYYQPANALVVRATSRLHTRVGGGSISAAPARMGAADRARNGEAIVIEPGRNRGGNAAAAKAPVKGAPDVQERVGDVLGGLRNVKQPAAPKAGAPEAVVNKDRDPKKAWQEAVEKGLFKPRQVIAVADLLAHFEKFDEVVELLKADLRHGVLAQPVAFDALALALKQSGGTVEEIERVRLSRIDLTPNNPQGYLKAAEAMAEMGRQDRAMEFCKRAAAIEPNAADPYAQSLVLLASAKDGKDVDTDAVKWAADNLAQRGWGGEGSADERLAQKALVDVATKLAGAGRKADADQVKGLSAQKRSCDLSIQAQWSDQSDVDLEIVEPIGSICSAKNRLTVGGGRWYGDRLMSAKDAKDKYQEKYEAAEAFSGSYEIRVRKAWGKPMADKVAVTVIKHKDTPQQQQERLVLQFGPDGTATAKVHLDGGRRNEAAVVPAPTPRSVAAAQPANPDRVFNLLRGMAEPTLAAKAGTAGGATAGTLADQVVNSAIDVGPEVFHQNKVRTEVGAGADVVREAVVSSDRRSIRMTVTPAFQTASEEPEIKLSLIPGGN